MALIPQSPATRLLIALLLAFGTCLFSVFYITAQPWTGLLLESDFERDVLVVRQAQGPTQGVMPGALLRAVGTPVDTAPGAADPLPLRAVDRIEEPDILPAYAQQREFVLRQGRIRAYYEQATIRLVLESPDGAVSMLDVVPGPRPVLSLPITFWVQWAAALAGILLGGWVWSLRPSEPATRAFAMTGIGLFFAAAAASIYSSRELALPADIMRSLGIVNLGGTILFQMALIALFLVYPRRLVPMRWLWLIVLCYVPLYVLSCLRLLPDPGWGTWQLILLSAAGSIVLGIVQWRKSRDNPVDRAPMRWMGLITILACCFFCIAMLPNWLSGEGAGLAQGWAFGFFMLIYVGLAMGVRRYRLFELDEWAFRILVYAVATIALILMDALLVYVLHLGSTVSLGLSLLVIGFLYLPLRAHIWSRLVARHRLDDHEVFRGVLDIVLADAPALRAQRWQALLQRLFEPLEIRTLPVTSPASAEEGQAVRLEDDGMAMVLPGAAPDGGSLRLRYPWRGRGLFGAPHLQQVTQLLGLLRHAQESRQAFERGASHERHRIASDLHDDVGAALLSGMHQPDIDSVRQTMREVMTDIRSIVTGLTGQAETLADLMAALRYEAAERLEAAGLALDWASDDLPDHIVSYLQVKSLRSCLREAISNVIRHAGARHVSVRVSLIETGTVLRMVVQDDGCGIMRPTQPRGGNGLRNMGKRLREIGGTVAFDKVEGSGARLTLQVPVLLADGGHACCQ